MDIKQMTYFKTIVEQGTISKAAEVLHMAQPPLSMQLKQLEEELGVILLKRGHRKIEMTPAGKLLYKRSLQMLSLHESTLSELQHTQNKRINIGITSSNHSLIFELQNYFHQHQDIFFRIHEGSTYELLDSLQNHTIDLGIVRTPFDQSQVNSYFLKEEPMMAVGDSSFLNKQMIHIKDYKDIPLIIHQRYLPLILDYCLSLNFNPLLKMTCDDCRTSLVWAHGKQGVAIVPQSALCQYDTHSLVVIPLQDQELYTQVAFITRKNEFLEDHIKELIEQF